MPGDFQRISWATAYIIFVKGTGGQFQKSKISYGNIIPHFIQPVLICYRFDQCIQAGNLQWISQLLSKVLVGSVIPSEVYATY